MLGGVSEGSRLVTVVLEVVDLDRSKALYRDGFGLNLHEVDHGGGEHGEDDRWTSGRHASTSWTDGASVHFALYESKGERTSRADPAGRSLITGRCVFGDQRPRRLSKSFATHQRVGRP